MSVDVKNRLAVALHYDKTGAPRVVAKGKGTVGEKTDCMAAIDHGFCPGWLCNAKSMASP